MKINSPDDFFDLGLQSLTPPEVLLHVIKLYPSMREFAKQIGEDCADVHRWKSGKIKIKAKAIVSICRLHPNVKPYYLNPHVFPKDLKFKFGD